MNGIKYLLDTNIIIGMYEHNPSVLELFKNNQVSIDQCAYSSITRMELLGFPDISENEIKLISTLLTHMSQLAIDRTTENKTISLKQQHRIKLPDAIILATAITNKIELLTLDKKLASKIQHNQIIS